MANDPEHDRRETYQIRVRGRLDRGWSDWFDGMTIAVEQASDGSRTTTLTGAVDQSALHGILAKIGVLNLKLVSVIETQSVEAQSGYT
jgi:hypothetical protein